MHIKLVILKTKRKRESQLGTAANNTSWDKYIAKKNFNMIVDNDKRRGRRRKKRHE